MDGSVFERIRRRAGLSQQDFADKLGVKTVANWEHGKSYPNTNSMTKISDFCKSHHIDDKEAWDEWSKRLMERKMRTSYAERENVFARIRKSTGLSQQDFASALGVTSVANWETGKCYPNYRSMAKLVDYCSKHGIDYSEAQEAWKLRNNISSTNKRIAQRRRWRRVWEEEQQDMEQESWYSSHEESEQNHEESDRISTKAV